MDPHGVLWKPKFREPVISAAKTTGHILHVYGHFAVRMHHGKGRQPFMVASSSRLFNLKFLLTVCIKLKEGSGVTVETSIVRSIYVWAEDRICTLQGFFQGRWALTSRERLPLFHLKISVSYSLFSDRSVLYVPYTLS